jgi:polyisoprenoid-binding protein YceI
MQTLPGGTLEVLSFKRGLLSKVAHDLMLRCERFSISTDGEKVEAEFDLDSISVVGVMREGVLDSSAPSAGDRREILDNVRKHVLKSDRNPRARFEGDATRRPGGARIDGTLELAGKRAAIGIDVRESDGRWSGEVELTPTRWGIEPFKALLGAIKLQDRVVVRFDVPVVPL